MTTVIRAQRVEVEETTATFGKASYPAMTTQVMFTDAKSVIKEFTTMLKSYNPETLEVKKNLITVDNVIIPAISENPIDIFANITQSKGTDVVKNRSKLCTCCTSKSCSIWFPRQAGCRCPCRGADYGSQDNGSGSC